MKDLQDAIEKICELKGECLALQTLLNALVHSLPPEMLRTVAAQHAAALESVRITLLNSDRAGDSVASSFEHHAENMESMMRSLGQERR